MHHSPCRSVVQFAVCVTLVFGAPAYAADESALVYEAFQGNTIQVKRLLDEGAYIDECDDNGYSALHWAAYNGHVELVRLLIQRRANRDLRDFDGQTPLILATAQGHLEPVRALLAAGANVEATSKGGFSVRDYAERLGNPQIIHLIAEAAAGRRPTMVKVTPAPAGAPVRPEPPIAPRMAEPSQPKAVTLPEQSIVTRVGITLRGKVGFNFNGRFIRPGEKPDDFLKLMGVKPDFKGSRSIAYQTTGILGHIKEGKVAEVELFFLDTAGYLPEKRDTEFFAKIDYVTSDLKLRPGDTIADIRKVMGKPDSFEEYTWGRTQYVYEYSKARGVTFNFDRRGLLESVILWDYRD